MADAVVRLADNTNPNRERGTAWCAIEFKLGQTSPAADLGQACLYHMMLAAAAGQATPESARQDLADRGTLALISFRPERHEQLFDAVLGHGDLLFKDIGPPRRLQAPLLTEADRDAIFG